MGTIRRELAPESAQFLDSAFPRFRKINGTAFPVPALYYDASIAQTGFWRALAFAYGTGDLSLEILWYADTATSGAVVWTSALAAITPNTDSQDVETKAFATAQQGATSHLGTVGQRVHRSTVAVSNLDSLAAEDVAWISIGRLPADAGDTMAGYAALITAWLSYSDV